MLYHVILEIPATSFKICSIPRGKVKHYVPSKPSLLKVCFFFANKVNRANKLHGLHMQTNFFLGIPKQSKQTEQAKLLVRCCSHESCDQNKS